MTSATTHSGLAHHLVAARGPFASIYFDDSHDVQNATSQLQVTWHDIGRELERRGADAAVLTQLQRAVLDSRPPAGRSGRGLIATARGVLIDEHLLTAPPAPVVRFSRVPYLVPLVEYTCIAERYTVVAIDHVGADLTFCDGATLRTTMVEGGGHPVHEAAAGVHGWGDQQHRVEEAIRKNVRAVADALGDDVHRRDPQVVFLIGQDRVRAELMSALPERIKALVVRPRVGARNTGVDDTVQHAIALEFQNRRSVAAWTVAQRFRAEAARGSGLAVGGLDGVCAALRDGAVATLILGDLANHTVLVGDDPTTVATTADAASLGMAATRTLRADEAIPFAALAGGAALAYAGGELDAPDGVAALLRYPPASPLFRP